MTTTSDDRREVAAELREASTGAYRHVDALDVIAGSVGVDTEGKLSREIEKETYAALADLIDPTCKVSSAEPIIDEVGLAVGWDFSLTCGHIVQMPWNDAPAYCPYCGARVASD